MTSQQRYLDDLTAGRAIRTTVRAIILHDDHVLVQRPSDDPDAWYGFIGGRVEFGESLEDRLQKELDDEIGAAAMSLRSSRTGLSTETGLSICTSTSSRQSSPATRFRRASRSSSRAGFRGRSSRVSSSVRMSRAMNNECLAVRHLIVPL